MRSKRWKAGAGACCSWVRKLTFVLGAVAIFLPPAAEAAAMPQGPLGSHLELAVPALQLTGLGASLSRSRRVRPSGAPARAGLSLGGATLRAPDEPDDADLLPALVPLVDLDEGSDGEAAALDDALSFEPIDLSDGESEDSGGELGPADAALSPESMPPPPETGRRSLVSRWWFWAAIGAAALAGGGVVAATSGPELVLPEGTLGTLDRR